MPTQKELTLHFREIINRIGHCDSVKTMYPEEYSEFCSLFTRHSDYPDKFIGLIDIQIKHESKQQLVVYILKNNGDIDDVSVLKNCITGRPKDNLKIAMRVAIQPQIYKFKHSQPNLICELCSEIKCIEIDHHSETMPFTKLYTDYLKNNQLPIPTTFDNTIDHMKCFKQTDHLFENEWIQFHEKNAILRLLCKKCNNSQPKIQSIKC